MATVSAHPAACGLHDRGALKLDWRADLIRVKEVGGLPVVTEVFKQDGGWLEGRRRGGSPPRSGLKAGENLLGVPDKGTDEP